MCLAIKRENSEKWDDDNDEKNEIIKNYRWKVEKFWLKIKRKNGSKLIRENSINEKVLGFRIH